MAKQVFFGHHPKKVYAFFEQWAQPHFFFVVNGRTRFHCALPKFLDRVIFGVVQHTAKTDR